VAALGEPAAADAAEPHPEGHALLRLYKVNWLPLFCTRSPTSWSTCHCHPPGPKP
jgi:hypothetical protein